MYIVRSITFHLDHEMDSLHFISNGEDPIPQNPWCMVASQFLIRFHPKYQTSKSLHFISFFGMNIDPPLISYSPPTSSNDVHKYIPSTFILMHSIPSFSKHFSLSSLLLFLPFVLLLLLKYASKRKVYEKQRREKEKECKME
jgi:hypothetical protein